MNTTDDQFEITKALHDFVNRQNDLIQIAKHMSSIEGVTDFRAENQWSKVEQEFPAASKKEFLSLWSKLRLSLALDEKISIDEFKLLAPVKKHGPEYMKYFSNISPEKTGTARVLEALYITMFSDFELFVGDLARQVYTTHKNAFSGSSKETVLLKDIIEYETWDALKVNLIDKKISQAMYGSYPLYLGNLFSQFGVFKKNPLPENLINFEAIESFARRNIVVHSDSQVSQIYLDKLSRFPNEIESLKVGDKLGIDFDYFKKASSRLIVIAVTIIWELCNTMYRAEEKLIREISIITEHLSYMFLKDGENFSVVSMLDDGVLEASILPEELKILQVNIWIALKRLGRLEEIKDDIIRWDLEESDEIFHIAKLVLLGDNEAALEKIRLISPSLSPAAKISWPLFEDIRKELFKDMGFKKAKRPTALYVLLRNRKIPFVALLEKKFLDLSK